MYFPFHLFLSDLCVGVKFVLTATPGTTELNELLHGVYEIYADYVLKVRVYRVSSTSFIINLCLQNPFYEIDMPIRCELFTKHLDRLVSKLSAAQGRRKQV